MAIDNASLTMNQRQVTDAQSGLAAYTYLAPEGWEINDQVIWDRHNMYNPAHLYARCYNNDGFTVQILAGYTNRYWATPFGNSGNYPPRDVTEALKTYMLWLRGVPVQFTEATVLSSSQQPGVQGFNMNTSILQQHGRIRGHYEKNGIRFDEIVYGTMTMTIMSQPPDYMGFFYEDISWDMDGLFLSCASGSRDPEAGVATAFTIKSSARQTQAFCDYEQQTVNLLRQQYNQAKVTSTPTVTEPVKEPRNIMNETNDDINRMREETRKKQGVTFDNNHQQFIDYINDVERYTDKKGTEHIVPTGYGGFYYSSLGKLLMVGKNSPDPDPYDTSYETWTKLEKKKY